MVKRITVIVFWQFSFSKMLIPVIEIFDYTSSTSDKFALIYHTMDRP